ncbi:gamma-glutamylcyclotransferase family protein [Planctomycetota bacterium]
MPQLIFGYGSLICQQSRDNTGDSGRSIPARLKGFKRGWLVNIPSSGMTAAGVVPETGAYCNGVLFSLPPGELQKYDARELAGGYKRLELNGNDITVLADDTVIPAGTVWIYTALHPSKPCDNCPLVQSYVDVILNGCLAVSREFATEFINTTTAWEGLWLNDRNDPRYVRAMPDPPTGIIDALLAECLIEKYHRINPGLDTLE